jgi:hypothetical protein
MEININNWRSSLMEEEADISRRAVEEAFKTLASPLG